MSDKNDIDRGLDEIAKRAKMHPITAERAFNEWRQDPIVRMAISMIPPGEHHDIVMVVLRSAFDHGVEVGKALFASDVLASVIEHRTKKP